MFSKVRTMIAGAAVTSALILTACGGASTAPSGTTVNSTDGIAFAETTLTLPANKAATVKFNNKSAGLQHNWVLVKGGDAEAAAADQAAAADTTNYIPAGDPNVVAHTNLVNGGASGEAAVPALAAGTYTYICTFPGHWDAGMKGVLTVQ